LTVGSHPFKKTKTPVTTYKNKNEKGVSILILVGERRERERGRCSKQRCIMGVLQFCKGFDLLILSSFLQNLLTSL
jgi:hypothetical protein